MRNGTTGPVPRLLAVAALALGSPAGEGKGHAEPVLLAREGHRQLHVQGYTGPNLALAVDDTTSYDVALHFDYRVFEALYPLLEFNVIDTVDVGAVAEFPVTSRRDILGWRVTTDLIWRPMGWNAIL